MWYDEDNMVPVLEQQQLKEERKFLEKFYGALRRKGKSLGSFISQRIFVGDNLMEDESWRDQYSKKFQIKSLENVKKKKLKKFYNQQNSYVEAYQEMNKLNQEFEAAQYQQDEKDNNSVTTDADSNAELLEDGTTGHSESFGDEDDQNIPEADAIESDKNGKKGKKQKQKKKKKPSLLSRICHSGETMSSKSRVFWEKVCVYLSYGCNIMLFCVKLIAAVSSMSLTVITSTLDSALDLLSGAILFGTKKIRHTTKKNDWWKYPVGKARYEPVGFLIFACVMSTASVMIIKEGVLNIFNGVVDTLRFYLDPKFREESLNASSTSLIPAWFSFITFWFSVGVMCFTIFVKTCLFCICFIFRASPAVSAYMFDHRNDVVSNSTMVIALFITGLFNSVFWWVDPLTAVLVSIYIIWNWIGESKEYIKKLVGRAADPTFLAKVTYLSINHHPMITHIDRVQAFHIGENFYVEVDIVVAPTMRMQEAHDIAENLQKKIEQIEDVERAFVHIDYDADHDPETEHKKIL